MLNRSPNRSALPPPAPLDPDAYPRFLHTRVAEALTDTPVALLHGPRQCGKTTLARQVCEPLGQNTHELVGVEVKAAATVTEADFKGLRKLQAAAGARFCQGLVLYDGERTLPFGPGLFAVPLQALWEMSGSVPVIR